MNTIFNLVALSLDRIAKIFHVTYNEINIIVYYMLIPLTWMVMVDFIVHCWPLLTIIWVFTCFIITWFHRKDFSQWCDNFFDKSADFLSWFERIGWDYCKASDIICVAIPIFIYIILFILLFLTI